MKILPLTTRFHVVLSEIHFRKKCKKYGFFIGSFSKTLPWKKSNRRVVYYDDENADISLKSIQNLSRLNPLPPPYLIHEPEMVIEIILLMDDKLSFLS